MKIFQLVLVASVAAILSGCASSGRSAENARSEAAIADPATLTLLRGDGSHAAWDAMIAACADADAVLIGECHGMAVGQAFQAKFFRDLIAKAPEAAGALEFIERDEQAALDDYLAGLTSETEFRRAAHRNDGNYTSGHRAIVEACKAGGRPVSAANAPRRYVRIARQDGFERLGKLTPEQQRLFVVPQVLPEGRYRDDFFKVMGGEDLLKPAADTATSEPATVDADPKKAEAAAKKAEADAKRRQNILDSFRSQSVWDWTMADSVAGEIDRGGKPTVLIVGRFHVDHGGGLVQALRRMRPEAKIVTISSVDAWSDSLRDDEKEIADFVVYIGGE